MKSVHASPMRLWPVVSTMFLAALAFSPAAHAQWKWRDGQGRVTISDTPPPAGIADKDILQRPTAPRRATPVAAAASAPAAANPLEVTVEAKRRQAEQEQQAKDKAIEEANAAKRAENCERARAHLRALDSGLRMARVNDKGEREILDDKARAAESQRARDIIASDCK